MPSTSRRDAANTDTSGYGPIFENQPGLTGKNLGKKWVEEALVVLFHRLDHNAELRALPLTPSQRKTLIKRSIDFLQVNQESPYEEDNLKHVGRLISNMKVHAATLKEFLDMDSEDVQLLAALHDLGKAKVPPEMQDYLAGVFGKEDFLGIRVIPHELFSFFWIERLCAENGIPLSTRQLLMDQVANHNFGPDLESPENKSLLVKDANGKFRHWWVEHWSHWSEKARAAGLAANAVYGHTVSPLANTLVLFDRIDGGHPHSWEKFLNQDLLSGRLDFTSTKILEVMELANATAREQLVSVGKQLKRNFTPARKSASIESFAPYHHARAMLDNNDKIVGRLRASNGRDHFARFGVDPKHSILYEDHDGLWYRFEAASQGLASSSQLQGKDWKQLKQSPNPVALLLEVVYRDWR